MKRMTPQELDDAAVRLEEIGPKQEQVGIYNKNMSKSMYDMDEQELGALIEKLSETVERLTHEKPGSGEYNHEAGVLKDARQLLAEKRKAKAPRAK
jgi:hypothetical protein